MRPKRVHIDQGISVYRRHQVWWIDVTQGGCRRRWNLHTRSRDHAQSIGRQLAGEIVSKRWNVALAGSTTLE